MIGNEKIVEQIGVAIASAKHRNTAPPHMLFSGHPGCGKTSMAKKIAGDLGTDFISITPEELKDKKSILNLLDSLNFDGYDELGNRTGEVKPTIVFLDECHRLPMYGQEKLGIIMESFTLDTGKVGKLYWVPYFTVIGATTLAGNLSKPFLDRFKLSFFFEPYNVEDSIEILDFHAKRLKIPATRAAFRDIAVRGRGVPRVMLKYLERCRDMMYSIGSELITSGLSDLTFQRLEIDKMGFNKVEIKVLKTLYDTDKAVSLENLALVTGESKKTLQNEVETYLIRNGYMVRTGQGRTITPKGRNYLEEAGYTGGALARKTIPVGYERR